MPRANSAAHTKWLYKYHIVFTPKYRREIVYNQYKKNLAQILHDLCAHKGVEIIEGHLMPAYVHMLVSIPPRISVSLFMGYLKEENSLIMLDRHVNLKYKFGNRHFWVEGYYISTVGLNDAVVRKCTRDQGRSDTLQGKMSVKEYGNPPGAKPGTDQRQLGR